MKNVKIGYITGIIWIAIQRFSPDVTQYLILLVCEARLILRPLDVAEPWLKARRRGKKDIIGS